MTLVSFEGRIPRIDPGAFVAPGAVLIGDVALGPESSVWYNCVLRGDMNRIRIGARSNVQDGTVIHVDPPRPGGPDEGYPCVIGDEVLIGHMAMVHGCTLRDRAFVGLGAIVMDGCVIEGDAMLAASLHRLARSRPPATPSYRTGADRQDDPAGAVHEREHGSLGIEPDATRHRLRLQPRLHPGTARLARAGLALPL